MASIDDEDELRATRKLNGVEWEEDFVTDENFGNKVGELEEISANEIIRTTEGKLYSIVSATEDDFLCNELNGKSNRLRLLSDLEIKNHKIDIIDLIEVGDVIQLKGAEELKYEVLKISWSPSKGKHIHIINPFRTEGGKDIFIEDIESIVTHEQFNSVMYKVKE